MIAPFAKIFHMVLIISTIGILLPPSALFAATITVNQTVDANGTIATSKCSLREAIIAASTDKPVDGCVSGNGDDTIILPSGTYTLTITGTDEDAGQTGDLDITNNLTLVGAGAGSTTIDGSGIDRVLHIDPTCSGINVEISGVTIRNGVAPDSADSIKRNGGGINNCGSLILADDVVSGNKTYDLGLGGGIFNQDNGVLIAKNIVVKNNSQSIGGAGISNSGTLMLTSSVVDGNTTWYAISSGGGIDNGGEATLMNVAVSNNTGRGTGGGISNRNPGHLLLVNSTVNNNAALNYYGGGIANESVLDVINSTISGNTAITGGGGIANTNLMSLSNVTVANNTTATGGGGAIYIYNNGILDIENSLLAYNSASGVKNNCLAPAGSITSYGYNLADDSNSCGLGAIGDKIGTDPLIGTLQDNGGMTFTHALLPGSPAIDAGNPSGCKAQGGTSDLLNDQRSFLRPADGDGSGGAGCDIGAYEYGAVPGPGSDLAIQVWGLPNPVAVDGDLTYNILVTNNGPLMADGVVITDTLPPNVTWLSSSTNKGICVGSKTIKCFTGPLFKAEMVKPTIVVKPNVAGMISNTATVSSSTTDPSVTNNTATATTMVSGLLPVRRLAGSTVVGSYVKLQTALDDSSNGNRVEAMAVTFNENVTIHSSLPITFSGGYDSAFSSHVGYSAIDGTLTFETGAVTVEYLLIQ